MNHKRLRGGAIRKCTSPGDKVYTVSNGKIEAHTVETIYTDFLVAGDSFFDFEEVGKTWFLTEKGAREHEM